MISSYQLKTINEVETKHSEDINYSKRTIFLSLHKNAVVITMIITSHIYQHYTAILSHL